MFTGLVECIGDVANVTKRRQGMSATLKAAFPAPNDLKTGDSVAVDGSCLTVTTIHGDTLFDVDISPETVNMTTLSAIAAGAKVNLERSLTPASRMGGHMVSGHVDGICRLHRMEQRGDFNRWELDIPADLARFIAPKGSITLGGVSLTVNRFVADARIELMLIPQTLSSTTLGLRRPGDDLNIEVDMLARYVARLMESFSRPAGAQDEHLKTLLSSMSSDNEW